MRTGLALISALVLTFSGARIGSATDNIDQKWMKCAFAGYDSVVNWQHTGTSYYPSATTPIVNATGAWTAVGRELLFNYVPSGSLPPTACRVAVYTTTKIGWPNENAWAVEINFKRLGFGVIERADIYFNHPAPFGMTWYDGTGTPSSSQIDRWTVALHEFGHAVALNHTQESSADVMWPWIDGGPGGVKRSLTSHDRAGISSLYPAN